MVTALGQQKVIAAATAVLSFLNEKQAKIEELKKQIWNYIRIDEDLLKVLKEEILHPNYDFELPEFEGARIGQDYLTLRAYLVKIINIDKGVIKHREMGNTLKRVVALRGGIIFPFESIKEFGIKVKEAEDLNNLAFRYEEHEELLGFLKNFIQAMYEGYPVPYYEAGGDVERWFTQNYKLMNFKYFLEEVEKRFNNLSELKNLLSKKNTDLIGRLDVVIRGLEDLRKNHLASWWKVDEERQGKGEIGLDGMLSAAKDFKEKAEKMIDEIMTRGTYWVAHFNVHFDLYSQYLKPWADKITFEVMLKDPLSKKTEIKIFTLSGFMNKLFFSNEELKARGQAEMLQGLFEPENDMYRIRMLISALNGITNWFGREYRKVADEINFYRRKMLG